VVAGSTGYVQYNNAGALGASVNLFWDIANSRLGVGTTTPGSSIETPAAVAAAFFVNPTTVSANYTIPTNYNAMTAGPITINSGITVTVPSGSTWVIA
jgi:hypothetical protein